MLLYAGGAAGLTWLVYASFAVLRQSSSPWRIAPLMLLSLILTVIVFEFVKLQVLSLPLDLVDYPPSARLMIFIVFCGVGRLASNMGQRRWRSTTSLRETRAAYRAGQMWNGFESVGKSAIWMAFVAIGMAMALPEWFLGF